MEGARLRCEDLAIGYPGRPVGSGLSLAFPDGCVTAVVGSNGSGKSTLLKTLARVLRPQGGAVYLDGKEIHSQPTKAVARCLAILPQRAEAPEALRVRELVSFGRFPYQRGLATVTSEDVAAVAWALDATGSTGLADRAVGTLSGGERQRVWISMALAQKTDLLLLDEPTTSLDVGHQIEVLGLIRRLNRECGKTVVMVLHDMNHAARYADRVVALADGRVAAAGTPAEVLTEETLARVFHVRADLVVHERTGALLCVPFEALPRDRGEEPAP